MSKACCVWRGLKGDERAETVDVAAFLEMAKALPRLQQGL
jgi:hypothetical protein